MRCRGGWAFAGWLLILWLGGMALVACRSGSVASPNLISGIAFVSDRDGNGEIYVMDADGASPHNVTDHPAADFSPAWSS